MRALPRRHPIPFTAFSRAPMTMKAPFLLAAASLALAGCAGDNHNTKQSPSQPTRYVERSSAGSEVNRPRNTGRTFARNRIYQITRLETADLPRGEWRALGETIKQEGSTIEFTELGSGKTVSFTAPHQITATSSQSDRVNIQSNNEDPNQQPSQPPQP